MATTKLNTFTVLVKFSPAIWGGEFETISGIRYEATHSAMPLKFHTFMTALDVENTIRQHANKAGTSWGIGSVIFQGKDGGHSLLEKLTRTEVQNALGFMHSPLEKGGDTINVNLVDTFEL